MLNRLTKVGTHFQLKLQFPAFSLFLKDFLFWCFLVLWVKPDKKKETPPFRYGDHQPNLRTISFLIVFIFNHTNSCATLSYRTASFHLLPTYCLPFAITKLACMSRVSDNHKCTEKRVSWRSLAHCYDLVENIVDDEDRKCG